MSRLSNTLAYLPGLLVCLVLVPACKDEAPGSVSPGTFTQQALGTSALSAPRPSHPSPADRNLVPAPRRDGSRPDFEPGVVLVRFHDQYQARAGALAADLGAQVVKRSPIGIYKLALTTRESVPDAVERIRHDPRVRYAEPNHRIELLNTPNDSRYDECWGMNNTGQTGGTADADIDAEEAWDISIGSWDVVVAVLDTGVDYNHEDLAGNMWTNEDEVPGNGIDDDNNGYIDDVRGWDFEHENNDPMDDYGHGTHCAGTIGAVGNNNVGVAGVNWRVTIMPLRIIGNQELDAYCLDAAESIHYAVDNGADIMSCSWWTVQHYNQTLEEAVQYAEQMEVFLVAAAGNDSRDDDDPGYNHWPSEWPYDNIVAVAATNHTDNIAYFSNFGPISVDVGAPGEDILSCSWGGGYELMSGTSMATPHVAGVLALMKSVRPDLTMAELKQSLMGTVDAIPDLQGITVTGGRVNAYTALAAISGVPLPPVALAGGDQTVMTGTTVTLDGSASFDPNQDPIEYLWDFYPPDHSSASLDDNTIAAPQFTADVCGLYQAYLTVTDDGGLASEPDRARVNVMNWADQNPAIETAHPYDINEDQTWTVTVPGAVVMAVHFASFDTEGGYDYVHIQDGDGAEWAVYDGALGEFTSTVVDGNTIQIHFTSDNAVNREGFVIDGVWWCDAGNCAPGLGDCNDDPADGCETDTSANPDNCGWCGHACVFPNATSDCVDSMCQLVACTGNFADCNGDVVDGCESDPLTDPDNCGGCDQACGPYDNGTAGCVNGGCVIAACDPGWDDCDGNLANGCETPVIADPDNCGACGIQCNLDHASDTYCEDGTCHVGDCIVTPQDIQTAHPYGNSEDLSWQIVHPGASAITVHFSMFNTERNYDFVYLQDVNGVEIAAYDDNLGAFTSAPVPGDTVNILFHSDGSVTRDGFIIDSSRYCQGTGCDAGWGDCDGDPDNGCETDTNSDLEHCGGCGQLCGDPNTAGQCTGGVCTPSDQCLPGFDDCNADMADGCEVDVNTDPAHCGSCGNACGDMYPNAETSCEAGGCTMGACLGGWANCNGDPADGCEVQVETDPDNCGSCGVVCDLDNVNVHGCAGGECTIGLANCATSDHAISSPHDYPDNYDETWEIVHPGAGQMRVHFTAFNTESGYDYVYLYDANNVEIAAYDGDIGEFWSDWVPGNTLRVRLVSDYMVTRYGFDIDTYEACDSGCDAGWGNCDGLDPTGCESDVSADPENCGACGAPCYFDNASGDCIDSECVISACDADFGDCNADGWDGCESDLNTDLGNCGGCGNACSAEFPNAEVTCEGGSCVMGACLAGFADCNSDPADGCEVDLQTDPANCGGCDAACALDNSTAGCLSGSCVIDTCDVGWDDCNGDPSDGCEQSVSDDDANCGGCGLSCNVPHGSAHCAGVACVMDSCEADWGDCDGVARNGCEANLPNNADNCGSCDNACDFPNATAACLDGVCAIGDCIFGFNDCNGDPADGCESDASDDVDNCGQCGQSCGSDHADSQCVNGTCFMGDCEAGWANCNHMINDGCEVNIDEDADNCGDCDLACGMDHGSAACSGGQCVVAECDAGWGDCDGQGANGCEAELDSDPNHCGACGSACDLANATAECKAGTCEIDQCSAGFSNCNGDDTDGCEIDTQTDPANCSRCGIACPAGQACEAGACVCGDADGDGHDDAACGGDDCNDDYAAVNPSAEEVCDDEMDNDCDGQTDEGCDETGGGGGGGCGCSTAGSKPLAGLVLFGLLGLLGWRRRR